MPKKLLFNFWTLFFQFKKHHKRTQKSLKIKSLQLLKQFAWCIFANTKKNICTSIDINRRHLQTIMSKIHCSHKLHSYHKNAKPHCIAFHFDSLQICILPFVCAQTWILCTFQFSIDSNCSIIARSWPRAMQNAYTITNIWMLAKRNLFHVHMFESNHIDRFNWRWCLT